MRPFQLSLPMLDPGLGNMTAGADTPLALLPVWPEPFNRLRALGRVMDEFYAHQQMATIRARTPSNFVGARTTRGATGLSARRPSAANGRGRELMLTEYICAALRHAEYEKIEDGSWFARIPGLQGVWGNGPTVEEARNDLQGALEGWILLGLRLGHPVPPVDGIDLTPALDVA